MYFKKLLFCLLAFLCSLGIYAQNTTGSWTITTNPSYFVLGGYSLKGFHHFPKKWSVGLQVEGGFELPDFARDQFFDINDEGTVDWTFAVGTEVRYRFTKSDIDKGFYLFGTLGYEGWKVLGVTNSTDEFTNWYSSLGLGYNWYPFKNQRLQIGAAYNLIFILNNTATRPIGEKSYQINNIVPPSFAPNLSVGWRF